MKTTCELDELQCNDSNLNDCPPNDFTMIEIFDTPESVGSPREADPAATWLGRVPANSRNRRRSMRWAFDAVIRVYGSNLNGKAFYEDARTINVSVLGALLALDVPVSKGQKLLLFNEDTQRQQVCQIVDVRVQDTGTPAVAVAFPAPHAEFWQAFPTRQEMPIQFKLN